VFLFFGPQLIDSYNLMFRKKTITAFALAASFLLPATFLNSTPQQGQAWSFGFGRNG
jgi:hypothetical protein